LAPLRTNGLADSRWGHNWVSCWLLRGSQPHFSVLMNFYDLSLDLCIPICVYTWKR
jgi:hypothetical protein